MSIDDFKSQFCNGFQTISKSAAVLGLIFATLYMMAHIADGDDLISVAFGQTTLKSNSMVRQARKVELQDDLDGLAADAVRARLPGS